MASTTTGADVTYRTMTTQEHILHRPDTYISSVHPKTTTLWVADAPSTDTTPCPPFVHRAVTFTPALLQLVDELLANAADNMHNTRAAKCRGAEAQTYIRLTINRKGVVTVENDGRGIPVTQHEDTGLFNLEVIMGRLHSSSNLDDTEERVTGGRNGYGAKLVNVFSSRFEAVSSSHATGKQLHVVWHDNMTRQEPAVQQPAAAKDFTRVTAALELHRFGVDHISDDVLALLRRRMWDLAATVHGLQTLQFNDERIPVCGFRTYATLFYPRGNNNTGEDDDGPVELVACGGPRDKWEVVVGPRVASDAGDAPTPHVSFVNAIPTPAGGEHVDAIIHHIKTAVCAKLRNKRGRRNDAPIKPAFVAASMTVFVRGTVINPAFDTQTKQRLMTPKDKFGSHPVIAATKIAAIAKGAVGRAAVAEANARELANASVARVRTRRVTSLLGIPNLDDAKYAGGPKSMQCSLIVQEGLSAKSLATAGQDAKSRCFTGLFPIKGKILNVVKQSTTKMLNNAEVVNLAKVLGLPLRRNVKPEDAQRSMRYGRLIIMADQDTDGSHIKGLIINIIHHLWPWLLQRPGFLWQFITPILRVSGLKRGQGNDVGAGATTSSFFTAAEFEAWKATLPSGELPRGARVKYFKGLGTSSTADAKVYFSNLSRHLVPFVPIAGAGAGAGAAADGDGAIAIPQYDGKAVVPTPKPMVDRSMHVAFNSNTQLRKQWVNGVLDEAWVHHDADSKGHMFDAPVSIPRFIAQELVEFSRADNVRSLPNVADGLKPSQRKIIYTCLMKHITTEKREVKVAQLGNKSAEFTMYHHAEKSLCNAIVNMGQRYVGSNNVPLMAAGGMFGSRAEGGKDAADVRYIFSHLSPEAQALFLPQDMPQLPRVLVEGHPAEVTTLQPVLPLILLNCTDGIGTGFSTFFPGFALEDVVARVRAHITAFRHDTPFVPPPTGTPGSDDTWLPSFAGFTGSVTPDAKQKRKFHVQCGVRWDGKANLFITELPWRTWSTTFENNLQGLDDKGKPKKKRGKQREEAKEAPAKATKGRKGKRNGKAKTKAKTASMVTKAVKTEPGTSDAMEYISRIHKHHTNDCVCFHIVLKPAGQALAQQGWAALDKVLNLSTTVTTNNMNAFTPEGDRIMHFDTPQGLLDAWVQQRLRWYHARKQARLQALEQQQRQASMQAKYIRAVRSGDIDLFAPRATILSTMQSLGLARVTNHRVAADPAAHGESQEAASVHGFEYLLHMHQERLCEEEAERLQLLAAKRTKQLAALKATHVADTWAKEVDHAQSVLLRENAKRQHVRRQERQSLQHVLARATRHIMPPTAATSSPKPHAPPKRKTPTPSSPTTSSNSKRQRM